jgi:hypothetical protein
MCFFVLERNRAKSEMPLLNLEDEESPKKGGYVSES